MFCCRACGSSNLSEALDLGKQPWGNDFIPLSENRVSDRYPLRLVYCHNCNMCQIDHTVPKETMFADHAYMSGTTKSLKMHFQSVGRSIINELGEGDLIVDIGGNDGTFLEYFHQHKKRCLNIDSGKLQAEQSESKGIPTVRKFFNSSSAREIEHTHGKAKIIHGSGVLFHLEELHSAFEGIKSLLTPDGLLVAEFIYLPEMVNNCAYDQIYHEHLLYYSLTSLSFLLRQHGLEIVDAEFAPIHGGSCIAKIGHHGQFTRTKKCEEIFRAETAAGVGDFRTYEKFGLEAARNRDILASLISECTKKRMEIHALGAPVKGSTIVNFCGFDRDQIACAVEINPHKFNTKIPGTQIPVFDERQSKPPDAYLLLSWNFKDEILQNFTDFRRTGGEVIIPIPTPQSI